MAPQDSSSIYYSARRFDAVNSVNRSPPTPQKSLLPAR